MTLPGGSQPDSRHGRTGTIGAQVTVLALLIAQAALLAVSTRTNGIPWQAKVLAAAHLAAAVLFLLSSIVRRPRGGGAPFILAAASIGLAAGAQSALLADGLPVSFVSAIAAAVALRPVLRRERGFLLALTVCLAVPASLGLLPWWPRAGLSAIAAALVAVAAVAELVCFAVDAGVIHELAARGDMEVALRKSESRLQLITDNMADTIILLDAKSLCTYVSPSVERAYGHRVGDLLGMPALLLVHPADREPLREGIERGIAEGKALLRTEYRFKHADGRFTWAESTLRVLYGPDGAYAGAVVSSRDSTERRAAEEALRSAYRVLVNSPAVVFRWKNEPGWKVELVTENVARYGWTAAELLSGAVSYASMVHPDDLEAVGREVQSHVASGHDVFHQEYRIRTASGDERWVDDHTVVERDEGGTVIGFQGIVVDITDRKNAEIALRISEEKFSKFFYTSPDAVDIARLADGLYLEVNTGFTTITGYTAAEAVGRTSIDLGIWVQAGERADLVREMTAKGGVPDREIRFRRKNGEIGFGLTSATLITIGGEPYLLSITKDITARRQLEREHEERRQFLERVLNNAPDAVVTSDARHRILEWNEGARRLFGYTAAEARGRTADELIAGAPGGSLREAEVWTRLISRGIGLSPTQTVRFRKDGTPVHVIASVAPIEIDHQVVEVVAIYTDISDRVRAEGEIRALNAQLEERVKVRTRELEAANRELEAFAYSVSHDLRAPLRSIDGFSQALEEDCAGTLAPTGREHLSRIRAGAQRMGELIDGLLALSRVTRVEMKLEVMDVAETARQILADLAHREPERRVEVRLPQRLPATCDQRLMRSALENLIGNAWKFTAHRRPGTIEIGAEPCADGIAYYVRDNGAGFDMAYAGKLFTAFQRLHKVEEYPGIGLGLANVQRIVHRHGGRVWADARPDEGATFWFTLPAPEDTP